MDETEPNIDLRTSSSKRKSLGLSKKGVIAKASGSVKKVSGKAVQGTASSVKNVVKVSGKAVKGTAGGVKNVAKASGKAVQGTASGVKTVAKASTKLFKKTPKRKKVTEELGSDEAEATLLANLEERRKRTIPTGDGFRPAVDGERAPLGIDDLGSAFDVECPPSHERRPSFKYMALIVHQSSQKNTIPTIDPAEGHRRAHTLLASIDESDDNEIARGLAGDIAETFGAPRHDIQDLDVVLTDAVLTDALIDIPPSDFNFPITSVMIERDGQAPESQPLLNGATNTGYSSVSYQRLQQAKQFKAKHQVQRILWCLNPVNLFKSLCHYIFFPFLVWALPLYVIAWILFYYLRNPSLDFLPGDATVSWWLNFLGRHVFLLQLSFILQTLIIDYLILSSRFVVKLVGPWLTIFCLQSKGWPFLVGCWGCLALIMLHGESTFQQHWLHFTGIRIYTSANSGSYILASDSYLRVLIGMVIAGIATCLKQTIVTLYFGKRNFEIYKPKLEEILDEIILISEIAELAAEADNLPDDQEEKEVKSVAISRRSGLTQVRWSSVRFNKDRKRSLTIDSEESSQPSSQPGGGGRGDEDDESNLTNEEDVEVDEDEESKDGAESSSRIRPGTPAGDSSGLGDSSTRKHFKIKNHLGRWDDPLNKMDKSSHSSVEDVLKFRRALTYMDLDHPFSESFGAASTRDELISSSKNVYQRLLKLSPDSYTLPFATLAVLCDNGDGTKDKSKRKTLRRLFRPDVNNEIPLLAFISSCDLCYKKLRYFRASVGNSSVIDKVLENIIDTIYYFVLVLTILSLLNLNPWPLLVSTSTLLVTFAFAVGPSCAKAIEGIILIIGRRPYDIGDRIIVSNSPGSPVAGVADSWFVEDITLFSTTLRFNANNEVATVSNGSIANSRITNCARSKNALVHLVLRMHIKFHEGDNLEKYREALDGYVLSHPQSWDSIVFFRCDDIDTDNEHVTYRLVVRNQQTWQPAAKVQEDRSFLHRFCIELAVQMKVAFDTPIPRRILYSGGELVDGVHQDYKQELVTEHNVRTSSNLEASLKELGDLKEFLQQSQSFEDKKDGVFRPTGEEKGAESGTDDDNDEVDNIISGQAAKRTSGDARFLSMLQDSHG